jgi:membrane protein DedA with SNARE-associated domain
MTSFDRAAETPTPREPQASFPPEADPAVPATPATSEASARGQDRIFGDLEVGIVDVLCIGPIVLASLWALFGTPISPGLISTHPVLLEALRGSVASMIAAGSFARVGTVPLWQAILAPLPMLIWVDPFYYWAGRRYGRMLLDYYRRQSPKMERRIGRAETTFSRYGIWTILFNPFLPFAPFLFLAAGETRMPFWKFLAADVVANLMYIGTVVSLGWFAGQRGVDVAEAIGHYGLYLTVALVALTVVLAFRQGSATARPR